MRWYEKGLAVSANQWPASSSFDVIRGKNFIFSPAALHRHLKYS